MGTELIRRGYRGPSWQANLDAPELVRAIHADYVAAGAQALFTNTFLAPEREAREVYASAVRSARSVIGRDSVILSLGPRRTPEQPVDFPNRDFLADIVDALAEVRLVLLETCSDRSAFDAASWIKSLAGEVGVCVSFAFRGNPPTTIAGLTPEDVARGKTRSQIDCIGVNCGQEQMPAEIAEVLAGYRRVTGAALLARPNAGTPHRTADGWSYPGDPESWANEVAKLTDAAMLGGCCGTTPDHIRALVRHLRRGPSETA
jgi:methionine synthase I (cobalamin-dependent)